MLMTLRGKPTCASTYQRIAIRAPAPELDSPFRNMRHEQFEFEDFVLSPAIYELRRGERVVKLQRIPLELLCLLIERRGELVTREEILDRVWGKGVFVDSETSINTAVRKLRRALGDSPEAPRFVATVPARGYRFIAEVRHPKSAALATSVERINPWSDAPVKYAKSGDVHLAYRVFGDGPRDIVLVPGTLSHAEMTWEMQPNPHLLKRLTAFARVIVFDKRGQGLSDRVFASPENTLEERITDIRAVMDAAGSASATIYGWSEGGPASLMFSATYPERTSSLVLYGTFASIKDPPWSQPSEGYEQMLLSWEARWGEGILLERNAPSAWTDEAARRAVGRWERATASPGSIVTLMRTNYALDVRHVLPAIRVPTLVLHRVADSAIPFECGRYLAQNIPGARLVEMPGTDHSIVDNDTQDFVADHIEEFVTANPSRAEPDRVLATVMFTYIAGPEKDLSHPVERQRELVNNCYELLRAELTSFRGREINARDDSLFATFDGPARAIQFACSARQKVHQLGLRVRTGLHTGECELIGRSVGGLTVDIAASIASIADPDQVLLSRTVKDLIAGSRLQFADRGTHMLQGISGELHLFEAQ
jgi:pimeloyl-ACP methyl ester carboxylesterase/DNA-binding winged helix-turn-helix (wHTH) protein